MCCQRGSATTTNRANTEVNTAKHNTNDHLFIRVTERANPCFVLQRRLGHGTRGFSSLLVGTLDTVFDSKVLCCFFSLL